MPLKKTISSLKRSYRKRKRLGAILSAEQQNRPVVNIHSCRTSNVGDYFSGPHHYFEKLKGKSLDIHDYISNDESIAQNFKEETSAHSLIIGGGGLLNRGGFEAQMKLSETLAKKGKKVVLWGVGHNSKNATEFGKINSYNIDVSKFGLVGTRDFSMPGEWVPCVSCLHPIFDKSFAETQETGIVFHLETAKNPVITKKFSAFPSISNIDDFEELIHFIGSSEKIITDSYHAMYWAMLMGKKVVVIPNSSKFFDFKYQPVISNFDNAVEDLKKTQTYSGVLEECREINRQFAGKVYDYLNM
jgi:exopolysaccharide biosynthesis predicted pyruvyltransferase EpsI